MTTQSQKKKITASEAFALAERYRLAVLLHRAAAAGIAYKVSQSPQFGAIQASSLEEYERCRLELMEAEAELNRASR
jgi:hypothetical protein